MFNTAALVAPVAQPGRKTKNATSAALVTVRQLGEGRGFKSEKLAENPARGSNTYNLHKFSFLDHVVPRTNYIFQRPLNDRQGREAIISSSLEK